MEVTSLCIRLKLNVLLLLAAHVHHSCAPQGDEAPLLIVPTRLQFFEYESVAFTCEGLNGLQKWRGVRNRRGFIPKCSNSTASSAVTCIINNAFTTESGEYWCEAGGGQRSNTVNITITGGAVILESPVLPVMEGAAVTLSCRHRVMSNRTADFYRDGLRIWTGYSGTMTIGSVSESDEGLYKCSISGAGESPESRLTLRKQSEEGGAVILESPVLPVKEGDAVTLSCRNRTLSTNLPAVFYKDGLFIGTSSTGNMTISYVYKSHEGVYRCNITGVGESPASQLTVRALHREACVYSQHFVVTLLLLRTVFTIVMVALLLLLVGLLNCGKLRVTHQ